MKALLSSAILALAATAMPASAALQDHTPRSQTGLPPGCFYIFDFLICLDMPIETGVATKEDRTPQK